MTNTISELVKVIRVVMDYEKPPQEIVNRVNNILDAVEGKQKKELVEFIKKNINGRRQKVAVLYATVDNGNVVRIGWSKTNTKLGDKFDKNLGLELAKERSRSNVNMIIPTSIGKKYRNFKSRCARYFKGAIVPLAPIKSPDLEKILERFGAEA